MHFCFMKLWWNDKMWSSSHHWFCCEENRTKTNLLSVGYSLGTTIGMVRNIKTDYGIIFVLKI